jgi:hypothetical protein
MESLTILPLSFVGFVNMPSDPQIIDTDGSTSYRHGNRNPKLRVAKLQISRLKCVWIGIWIEK